MMDNNTPLIGVLNINNIFYTGHVVAVQSQNFTKIRPINLSTHLLNKIDLKTLNKDIHSIFI